MFDFLEMLVVGQQIEAHGIKWLLIKRLRDGLALAVKEGEKPGTADLPAQVFMVSNDAPSSTK